jgi:hypothetical protein
VLRRLPWEVSQFLRDGKHPLLEKYPWLGELMEYEYLEIQVRFAEENEDKPPPGMIALHPAHALGEFTWPVHFISEKNHDAAALPRGNFYLLLWRDGASLEVKFMEVNLMVAAMVRALGQGAQTPEILLDAIAKQVGFPRSDEFLREGRDLIRNFTAQGILRAA